MGGKESKEKKFYTKSQTINLGKKKLGEVFDIDITTNSSIGTGYRIINENEYKEYLEYVGSSSKYEGKDGECGADSSNSISFKGIKTGSTCIKFQFTFRGRNEGIETYKVKITK